MDSDHQTLGRVRNVTGVSNGLARKAGHQLQIHDKTTDLLLDNEMTDRGVVPGKLLSEKESLMARSLGEELSVSRIGTSGMFDSMLREV